MARKKTSKGGVEKKFNGVETVGRVWKALTPGQWNALLTSIAPQNKWELKGTTISGLCPYHQESTASFKLQPTRGFGKCFGACGKHVFDIVELLRHLKKCTYIEALLFLVNDYKLENVLGTDSNALSDYHRLQEMKKQAAVAFNQVVIEMLRERHAYLSYLVPGTAYLLFGRGLSRDVLHMLPVGLFPKPEHAKKYIKEEYHALYDSYFEEYNKGGNWGKVIFHYNDSTGTISQFKMRDMIPFATIKELIGERGFEEIDQHTARQFCEHSFTYVADPYASEGRGVYGLHKYSRIIGRESADAYVTEGEFDALAVMNSQELLGRQDFMVLASGGSNNNLTFLADSDIKYIWLIPDHPSKNGDTYTANMLKHINAKSRNRETLQFKIFQWPAALTGLDLDEAVQASGYEAMYKYLYLERNDYFLNATPWVIRQCEKALSAIEVDTEQKISKLEFGTGQYDISKSNIEDNAKQLKHSALLHWVECLAGATEKAAFASKFEERTGIDITKSSDVHVSMFALDTMEGCVAALRNAITDIFAFAYYESKAGGTNITLWSKDRHETVLVKESVLDVIIAQYGMSDLLDWSMKILKEAPYVVTDDRSLTSMKKLTSDCKFLVNTAINGLMHQARPLMALKKVGQGIHYEWLPSSAKMEGYVYFVNGTKVFRGKFDDDTGKLNWEFLNNIVDGDIIFKLSIQDKWSYVDDVADLYEAQQVNIKDVYNKILKIIDGWKFENHEFMREYIATWIMSIPIQRAMGRVNMTFVTGDSNSGKTSLARGLLGGTKNSGHEVKPILEPAVFRSDATAASMYQEMDESALMFVLDEAETSESHNTEQDNRIKEIQRMCYSIATGGHTSARGGISADLKVSYELNLPVMMAGININNDPVFLSRVMTIYTQKDPFRKNIGDYIDDLFTEDEINLLRRHITIGLLPHLQTLRKIQTKLQRVLPSLKCDALTTGRFINTVLPALSVYTLLGHDPEGLYRQIVASYKHRLETISQGTTKMDLLHMLLYTKVIPGPAEDGYANTDARTLILNGDGVYLNNTYVGIYYIEELKWIVVAWRQAKYSILQRTHYSNMDEATLAETCAKYEFVIHDVPNVTFTKITKQLGITDIKNKRGITIIDAGYILDQEILPEEPEEDEEDENIRTAPIDIFIEKKPKKTKEEIEDESVDFVF